MLNANHASTWHRHREKHVRRAQKSHNRLLLSFLFNSCRSSVCICRPATSRVGCSFVPAVMTIFYLFYIFSLCSRFYFFLRWRRLPSVEFSSVKRVISSHRYLLFTLNSLHPCCCIEAAAVDLISDFRWCAQLSRLRWETWRRIWHSIFVESSQANKRWLTL